MLGWECRVPRCVRVTVQLPLYQVHPGADLVVQGLDVLQQVQLTLGHRRRPRLLRVRLSVCVFAGVVLSFDVPVCHRVCICADISWFPVDIFRFYFLQKKERIPAPSCQLSPPTNELMNRPGHEILKDGGGISSEKLVSGGRREEIDKEKNLLLCWCSRKFSAAFKKSPSR